MTYAKLEEGSPKLDLESVNLKELVEQIATGQVESITSRQGEALHIRPKAANGKVLTDALGPEGQRIKTRPRGFYLRKTFTHQILRNAFGG